MFSFFDSADIIALINTYFTFDECVMLACSSLRHDVLPLRKAARQAIRCIIPRFNLRQIWRSKRKIIIASAIQHDNDVVLSWLLRKPGQHGQLKLERMGTETVDAGAEKCHRMIAELGGTIPNIGVIRHLFGPTMRLLEKSFKETRLTLQWKESDLNRYRRKPREMRDEILIELRERISRKDDDWTGLSNPEFTRAMAAKSGEMKMFAMIQEQNKELLSPAPTHLCAYAAMNKHPAALQWLRSQNPPFPWDESACYLAAYFGELECLTWLRWQDPPCPWNYDECLEATKKIRDPVARQNMIDYLQLAAPVPLVPVPPAPAPPAAQT